MCVCSLKVCDGHHVASDPVDCRKNREPLFACVYAQASTHEVAGKGFYGREPQGNVKVSVGRKMALK